MGPRVVHRIVVMYGPPGIGKTEVVCRVAEYAADRPDINHFAFVFYIPLKVRSHGASCVLPHPLTPELLCASF